jgi:hypothetical protein
MLVPVERDLAVAPQFLRLVRLEPVNCFSVTSAGSLAAPKDCLVVSYRLPRFPEGLLGCRLPASLSPRRVPWLSVGGKPVCGEPS